MTGRKSIREGLVHVDQNRGIVIRTRDYGESHKVVVLFTAERGKLPVLARGRKARAVWERSRNFSPGAISLLLGSGMGTLSQGELISSHHGLRSDLLLTATAALWNCWTA